MTNWLLMPSAEPELAHYPLVLNCPDIFGDDR